MPNDDDQEGDDMPFPNRLAMVSARSGSATSSRSQSVSAMINLRGSRPNSAAIAQEIEGFEDDFMVSQNKSNVVCPASPVLV